jgi:hypothetical protein
MRYVGVIDNEIRCPIELVLTLFVEANLKDLVIAVLSHLGIRVLEVAYQVFVKAGNA